MSATTTETGLGALGPYYDYSNELKYPSELAIDRDGDIFTGPAQIERNVRGVKYYMDAIAFGNSVPFPGLSQNNELKQAPMGLNFFFNTGQQCSNGADMYQYMTTIPSGLPGSIGAGLKKKLGSNLQGLAPGALQDSFEAMNPVPILGAVIGSGFPKCKLIERPVGDANGNLRSRFNKPVPNADPTGSDNPEITEPNIWVDPRADKVYYKPITGYMAPDLLKGREWKPKDGSVYIPDGPQPHMRRWVFDKWIEQDEYEWTQESLKKMGKFYNSKSIPDQNTPPDPKIPKQPTENEKKAALQSKETEGFGDYLGSSQIGAGVLFAALFVGLVAFTAARK